MKEREIEAYLVRRATELGGRAYKFVSPGCSGVPDRIVVLPRGRIGFLELKAPGEKPRRVQEYRIRQLREMGCMAWTADSLQSVERFLSDLGAGCQEERS